MTEIGKPVRQRRYEPLEEPVPRIPEPEVEPEPDREFEPTREPEKMPA